uniref:Uncharacterized protein LOC104223365 n=1 Tax=Nicotiana sylvestris TaxID=4096 RepID=A0A1U7WFS8_NICSY|nr:PREDICTED: uncharacterized protein LOC104223365 [Nicotiana sylvestris]
MARKCETNRSWECSQMRDQRPVPRNYRHQQMLILKQCTACPGVSVTGFRSVLFCIMSLSVSECNFKSALLNPQDDQLDGGGENVGMVGMVGSEGMLGRGFIAGIGGRFIFGTEGKVGKEGNGVAVGSAGNGGNVDAVGKLGIVGNFGIVG